MTQATITEFKYLVNGDIQVIVIRLPSAQNGNVIDLTTKGIGGLKVLKIEEYDAAQTPALISASLATLDAGGNTLTVNSASTRTIFIWAR